MPRKCCVPACKGNCETGPKVSAFTFPNEEDLKSKWLRGICRSDFVPTKHSVVCELHFRPCKIEKFTTITDSKTGETFTAPLSKPRLVRGAIPSCPKYLSGDASTSREGPEERRWRIESASLKTTLEESIISHKKYTEAMNISSFAELREKINTCQLANWITIFKPEYVNFIYVDDVPLPKIISCVRINSELMLSAFYENSEITRLSNGTKKLKLPFKVQSLNDVEGVLHIMHSKFCCSENNSSVDDILAILADIFATLSSKLLDQNNVIDFLREQALLLNTAKNKARYKCETIVLCSLLYSISPHCYKFLRGSGVLHLPSPSTISQLCTSFSINPVFEQNDNNLLPYIKLRATALTDSI